MSSNKKIESHTVGVVGGVGGESRVCSVSWCERHLVNLAQCGNNYRYMSESSTLFFFSLDVRECVIQHVHPGVSLCCGHFIRGLVGLGSKPIPPFVCVWICLLSLGGCWNVPCELKRYLCYSTSICLPPLFICCFNDLIDCPLGSEGLARYHHITTVVLNYQLTNRFCPQYFFVCLVHLNCPVVNTLHPRL